MIRQTAHNALQTANTERPVARETLTGLPKYRAGFAPAFQGQQSDSSTWNTVVVTKR